MDEQICGVNRSHVFCTTSALNEGTVFTTIIHLRSRDEMICASKHGIHSQLFSVSKKGAARFSTSKWVFSLKSTCVPFKRQDAIRITPTGANLLMMSFADIASMSPAPMANDKLRKSAPA